MVTYEELSGYQDELIAKQKELIGDYEKRLRKQNKIIESYKTHNKKSFPFFIVCFSITVILFGSIVFHAGIFLSTKNNEKKQIEKTTSIMTLYSEQAYFEGQKDALSGDIKIKKNKNGWCWIKSPWNDGRKPVYDFADNKIGEKNESNL